MNSFILILAILALFVVEGCEMGIVCRVGACNTPLPGTQFQCLHKFLYRLIPQATTSSGVVASILVIVEFTVVFAGHNVRAQDSGDP